MNSTATKILTTVLAAAALFLVMVDGSAVYSALTQTAPASASTQKNLATASPSPTNTAAPGSGSTSTEPSTPTGSLTASEPTSDTTSNWSGYAATGQNFTSISGSWTVPTATGAGDTSADATWVGIGGVTSNDLIQVGTQNLISPAGGATTSVFYELLPDASEPVGSVSVNPGDLVTASITETGTNLWAIDFTDNTTGQSYSTSVSYDSSNSSAEWIEEDPSDGAAEIPLDSFGTVAFTGASATENGGSVNLATSNAQVVTMVNDQDQFLATVSPLSSDDASFSVTRTSASSVSPIPQFNHDPGGWVRRGSRINGEGGAGKAGGYGDYSTSRYFIPRG